jgi:hypothetical protein
MILIFKVINDNDPEGNVITSLFKAAGYTYGPLLGLFSFGLFTKFAIKDNLVPLICVITPTLSYILNENSVAWFNGYKFGFEILIVNGLLTFIGLLLLAKKQTK